MNNPLLESLRGSQGAANLPTQNNPAMNTAVSLYRAYKVAKNPAAALQEMMAKNPALAQLQQLKNGGVNMQQAFYSLCQEQGVDPQSVLTQFQ